jgi:hypothetical protein
MPEGIFNSQTVTVLLDWPSSISRSDFAHVFFILLEDSKNVIVKIFIYWTSFFKSLTDSWWWFAHQTVFLVTIWVLRICSLMKWSSSKVWNYFTIRASGAHSTIISIDWC